jgi:tetratricopeptide (TPR) repeat protein
LGKNSTVDRIEKVIDFEAHRIIRAINDLGIAGMLIIETEESRFGGADTLLSRHDLLSNAALERLTPPARAFLHRSVGGVLESEIADGRSTAILWDCADHWHSAGNVGRALLLARSCATHLMEVGLPAAAADAYQKSLAYCSNPSETLEILEGQAHAFYRSHAWRHVSEVVARARRVRFSTEPERLLHDELELMALRAEWRDLRQDRVLPKALNCLNEPNASANHRVEAGSMALKLSDLMCDQDSMRNVYGLVETLCADPSVRTSARLQAALVFNTSCGILERGLDAARLLIEEQRSNGNVGDLIGALGNASVALRISGLFDEAEKNLLEALSISEHHGIGLGYEETLPSLANLALETGRTKEARRWYDLLRARPLASHDKLTGIEFDSFSVRLALLSNRPSDAEKYLSVRTLGALKRNPVVFRRSYQASLLVATDLACGRVPSHELLALFEATHIRARGSMFQAYPAYVLYVGLKAAGRGDHASKLLTDYLTIYRREPYPAPTHLLTTLERSVRLARKGRNG